MQTITVLVSAACAALVQNLHAEKSVWVGIAADLPQALTLARELQPDIFLHQQASLAESPASFFLQLHSVSPHTKVLLFYDSLNHVEILDALAAGVKGCLHYTCTADDCVKSFHAVHAGDIWLGRHVMSMIVDSLIHKLHPSRPGDEVLAHGLSAREREIAAHMRHGLSNKAIAQKLGISDLTVKTHLKHIFHKLKISHRYQLGIAPITASRP